MPTETKGSTKSLMHFDDEEVAHSGMKQWMKFVDEVAKAVGQWCLDAK
jgi:hypothetical protein